MELKIRKDMLADKIRKAVYAPRVCVRFEAIQKCLIGGNAIAQTDAGGGKELGGAAENHDVVIIICQRNCREFCHIIGEFHVSLIYHDIDVVLLAASKMWRMSLRGIEEEVGLLGLQTREDQCSHLSARENPRH